MVIGGYGIGGGVAILSCQEAPQSSLRSWDHLWAFIVVADGLLTSYNVANPGT